MLPGKARFPIETTDMTIDWPSFLSIRFFAQNFGENDRNVWNALCVDFHTARFNKEMCWSYIEFCSLRLEMREFGCRNCYDSSQPKSVVETGDDNISRNIRLEIAYWKPFFFFLFLSTSCRIPVLFRQCWWDFIDQCISLSQKPDLRYQDVFWRKRTVV